MENLTDPGGRYAVRRVAPGYGQELAEALNEGDAKGWRLVHMVYQDFPPLRYIHRLG
jgi:hypothetical protein